MSKSSYCLVFYTDILLQVTVKAMVSVLASGSWAVRSCRPTHCEQLEVARVQGCEQLEVARVQGCEQSRWRASRAVSSSRWRASRAVSSSRWCASRAVSSPGGAHPGATNGIFIWQLIPEILDEKGVQSTHLTHNESFQRKFLQWKFPASVY